MHPLKDVWESGCMSVEQNRNWKWWGKKNQQLSGAVNYILSHSSPVTLKYGLAKLVSCRGWAETCDPPASVSQSADIIGIHHCAYPLISY